ncbi:MAG: hypothetical protein WCF84_16285 [Anaerolineae bacterium]
MLIVQNIITTWTKKSRAGADAGERNAVLEMLPLPSLPEVAPPDVLIYHEAVFAEQEQFIPKHRFRMQELIANRWLHYRCVHVRWTAAVVEAKFVYTPTCGGAPQRSEYPRVVLHLARGTWGQIRYNGRFTSMSGDRDWSYRKTVVNIAYCDELMLEPFAGAPVKVFSEMADLW